MNSVGLAHASRNLASSFCIVLYMPSSPAASDRVVVGEMMLKAGLVHEAQGAAQICIVGHQAHETQDVHDEHTLASGGTHLCSWSPGP